MGNHEYTAEEALGILLKKLGEKDESLASHVQAAIDVGKDVSDSEPSTDRRKKARTYRKTVPFTHEEAFPVALDVLQAYFVEQPLFIDAAEDVLAQAAVGVPAPGQVGWRFQSEERESFSVEHQGEEKVIEIELQTETQIIRTGAETLPLKRTDRALISQQQENICALRSLTEFRGN